MQESVYTRSVNKSVFNPSEVIEIILRLIKGRPPYKTVEETNQAAEGPQWAFWVRSRSAGVLMVFGAVWGAPRAATYNLKK